MRELAQEGSHLQTAVRTLGSFCSQGCLAAAVALAALELWAGEFDGRGRGAKLRRERRSLTSSLSSGDVASDPTPRS
jgi:hypothetical protein